ncbi:MAG: S8 family serine peptidase [Solirubrobacteraceae bacterium]|nr:S8 family serine peptidase [Solirubrobacteraceae bacterium]
MSRLLRALVPVVALLATAVPAASAADAPAYRDGVPLAHVTAASPRQAPAPLTELVPNDPGRGNGWEALQWNFSGPYGVNAKQAWANAANAGGRGGRGVVVAVLDTGVAYRTAGRFRQSPDFSNDDFVAGYDFVDGDEHPDDHNGHGTHVASTVGESTNNGIGLTGLAYGARIMPVRVLDSLGEGDALTIAKGVRFATRNGASVINLSLEFAPEITSGEIPELLSAIRAARDAGVLVVGASGNEGYRTVAWPARAESVFAVGATTERGCLSEFSNEGRGLDIVAPGGGQDASTTGEANCTPAKVGRPIYQLTFSGSVRTFGLPNTYEGTSMAAPHVSAVAALVIASKVLGAKPTVAQLESHLERTARDLGTPGRDTKYGSGLLDAAAATAPKN